MAGLHSARGLRRWSRRGERCTQAQCPRPPGAALRPFPSPASMNCGAWCVCDGVLVTLGMGDAWCSKNSDARACIVSLTPVGPPPAPFCKALLPAHSAPPALRAAGININNGVRGRGRGSGAGGHRTMSPDTHWAEWLSASELWAGAVCQRRMGAWSRGSRSEAVCVRAYMQAHTHFQCPATGAT